MSATVELGPHSVLPVAGRVLLALVRTARAPRSITLDVVVKKNPDVPPSTLEHILNIIMVKIASGDVEMRDLISKLGARHLQKDCARKILEH